MIAAIIAFFYITFICRSYGILLFSLLAAIFQRKTSFHQPFIITCFSGLAFIAVLATFLSLLVPLGSWAVHFLLLVPVLYQAFKERKTFFLFLSTTRKQIQGYPTPLLALLISSVLLIYIMHAWVIIHPDTLAYHAQNIQWIENYRAVPGLVNLSTNYGIQSTWFILCAIFSFSFTGSAALTFVNATVLTWFVIFVVQKIKPYLQRNQQTTRLPGLLWLSLLAVSFVSYTQIRLTATSGSPDFIVALYSWLTIYLVLHLQPGQKASSYLLPVFLGFFAITIKLSALLLLPIAFYGYYKFINTKNAFRLMWPLATGVIVLAPLLARNVISTGYLLFPSAFPDIFTVDWKAPKELLDLTTQYITAYARTNAVYDQEEISAVANMAPVEWLPRWWSLRTSIDKIILAAIPLLLVILIVFRPRVVKRQHNSMVLPVLLLVLTAILFWFTQAPDPRFGFGFLLPAAGLLVYMIAGNGEVARFKMKSSWLSAGIVVVGLLLAIYSTYRLNRFFTKKNILVPAGVISLPYKTISCYGIPLNIPAGDLGCGGIPLPCSKDPCTQTLPRGKNLQAGFKRK